MSPLASTSIGQGFMRLPELPGRPGLPPGGDEGARSGAIGGPGGDFRAERGRLDAYMREREAAVRAKHGDTPPDTVATVGHVVPGRGTPFVTADQQKLMDAITDRHGPNGDFAAMYAELKAAGVHPDQLAQSARWFIGHDGVVRDRQGEVVQGAFADVTV